MFAFLLFISLNMIYMVDKKTTPMSREDLRKAQAFKTIGAINKEIKGDVDLMEADPDTSTDKLSNLTIRLRQITKRAIAKDKIGISEN